MRRLSEEAETRLIAAIEKAAALVNTGDTPNAAIVKIARDENMPAGHVRLMVHAYNTGRTTKQRELGESANEKSADFQLADADSILDTLYPAVVKSAAEIKRDEVVSTEYAVPPTGFLSRRRQVPTSKAAAVVEKTWTPPPRDEHAAAMREYSAKKAAKQADEELRRQATAAYSKAAAVMDQLHEYFRRPGNMPFQDAVRETELRHGELASNALKKIAAVYPHLEKQAATDKRYFGECVPCELALTAVNAVSDYNEAKSRLPQPKTAAVSPAPAVVTGSILYNPLEESLELKKANASPELPTGPVSATRQLGQQLFEGAGSYMHTPDKMRASTFKELTDPEHERKLRNIRAQSVVSDLMVNDPVISGHDPREVANAFNELAEVAPNFMDSTATVQALLRKRLEAGQLADFDIKQLMELEKIRAEKQKNLLDAKVLEKDLV